MGYLGKRGMSVLCVLMLGIAILIFTLEFASATGTYGVCIGQTCQVSNCPANNGQLIASLNVGAYTTMFRNQQPKFGNGANYPRGLYTITYKNGSLNGAYGQVFTNFADVETNLDFPDFWFINFIYNATPYDNHLTFHIYNPNISISKRYYSNTALESDQKGANRTFYHYGGPISEYISFQTPNQIWVDSLSSAGVGGIGPVYDLSYGCQTSYCSTNADCVTTSQPPTSPAPQPPTCEDNQTILKLYSTNNSHAEMWNAPPGANVRICYDQIFGSPYISQSNLPYATPHDPTPNNTVVRLSTAVNAHAQVPSLSSYLARVTYGNLICRNTTGSCNISSGEREVVRLSSETNAHLAVAGTSGYPIAICCKPNSISAGSIGQVYWGNGNGDSITNTCVNKTIYAVVKNGLSAGTPLNISIYLDASSDSLVNSSIISADGTGTDLFAWAIPDNAMSGDNSQFYFRASATGTTNTSSDINTKFSGCGNIEPVAQIAKPLHRQMYYANVPIEFNETSYDVDGSISSWLWSIEEDGVVSVNGNRTFNKIFDTSGEKTITLRVTDNQGKSNEQQIAILVLGNNGILAFINKPSHMQEIVNNLLYSDGYANVDFSANDSYVVTSNSSGTPCNTTVVCLAGNCPNETQQSPVCSGMTDVKIPMLNTPQSFNSIFFGWSFPDIGISKGGYGQIIANVNYSSMASNLRVANLTLNYTNSSLGLNLFQRTSRIFLLESQCQTGGLVFYNITSQGKLDKEHPIYTSQNQAACSGPDRVAQTHDDCCPAGFSCSANGCTQNQNVTILCNSYTTQNDCNNDNLRVGVSSNYPAFWTSSPACGGPRLVTDSLGNTYNVTVNCKCMWNATIYGGFCDIGKNIVQTLVTADSGGYTSPSNPTLAECVYNYTRSECVNGYITISASYSCSSGNCANICENIPQTTIPCGNPSIALPIFGLPQAVGAIIIIVLIYLFLSWKKKRK